MFKKILCTFFALPLLASSGTWASYQQKITLCGSIRAFQPGAKFRITAQSSDFFDDGFSIPYFSNGGPQCKFHTYQHGPKKMALLINIHERKGKIKILDNNCNLKVGFYADYIRKATQVDGKVVTLNINIDQIPSSSKNEYIYRFTCFNS